MQYWIYTRQKDSQAELRPMNPQPYNLAEAIITGGETVRLHELGPLYRSNQHFYQLGSPDYEYDHVKVLGVECVAEINIRESKLEGYKIMDKLKRDKEYELFKQLKAKYDPELEYRLLEYDKLLQEKNNGQVDSSSAILCNHANESPSKYPCDCRQKCYCYVHGNCGKKKVVYTDPKNCNHYHECPHICPCAADCGCRLGVCKSAGCIHDWINSDFRGLNGSFCFCSLCGEHK